MQEVSVISPFYLDWKFWSVAISFIALLLSQLPPVHIMLRRAKAEIEVYNRIHITHMVGNPNAQLHIILSNVGGRILRVRSLALRVRHEDGGEFTLPAQNYHKEPADKDAVLLTSFKLKPGSDWGHLVNFLNFFNRAEEKEFRAIESSLRENILAKRAALENPKHDIPADDAVVTPVLEFFNKKYQWKTGEYEVEIIASIEPSYASIVKKYRFVLFESDVQELVKVTRNYVYGGGVLPDLPSHVGFTIPLLEV